MLFLSLFFTFGTNNKELKPDRHEGFISNISKQQKIIESKMNLVSASLTDSYYNVKSDMELEFGPLSNIRTATKEEQNDFISNISGDLFSLMEVTGSTGAYIILENNLNESQNTRQTEGLLIRDIDDSYNNTEYVVSIGDQTLLYDLQIPAGEDWKESFILSKTDDTFSYNHLKDSISECTNNQICDLKYVGYNTEDGENIVTYSIPILDESNKMIAIIGVELSNYFFSYFTSGVSSLSTNILGRMNGSVVETVYVNGSLLEDKQLNVHQTVYNKIYLVEDNQEILAGIEYLSIYNQFNPNNNEQWVSIILAKESTLMQSSEIVEQIVALNMIISLIFGALIIYFSIKYVIRPVRHLSTHVKNISENNLDIMKKTNIFEVDYLIESIRKINKGSVQHSQISNAIDSFSLGIFFYRDDSNDVYCSQPFYDICGINKKEGYIDKKEFKIIFELITDNNYYPDFSAHHLAEDKWIKIITKEENDFNLGIITDVTNQINEILKIEKERDIDSLTKLFNRTAFNKVSEKIFSDPDIKVIAVIMWDIDKLKYINDTYGHESGDRYICKFAETIKYLEDFNGVVSRRSGDEFLGLLYGDSQNDVIHIINDLRNKINESFITIGDIEEKLRVSTGIAWYPDDGNNLNTLINYADFALYEVKYNIRGITNYFNKDTYPQNQYINYYSQEFDRILEGDFITFAYQPIVDAKTGEIFGHEFLMRIYSEIINTNEKLISLAKYRSKLDLVEEITYTKFIQEYLDNIKLFGDSKIFIYSLPNIRITDEKINDIFSEFKNNLDMIVVEYIEYENLEKEITIEKTKVIKDLKASISINNVVPDNINELLDIIPIDYIKVDMSIVDSIDFDEHNQDAFDKIINYARSRNIKVIAEGVKTHEEMKYLINAGVDYLQGRYLGMPSTKPNIIPHALTNKIKEINNNKT